MNKSFERRLASAERRVSRPGMTSSNQVIIMGGFGTMGSASAGGHTWKRAPFETLKEFSARISAAAKAAGEMIVVIRGWPPAMDVLDDDAWRAACAKHAPLPAPPVPGIEGLSTADIDPAWRDRV